MKRLLFRFGLLGLTLLIGGVGGIAWMQLMRSNDVFIHDSYALLNAEDQPIPSSPVYPPEFAQAPPVVQHPTALPDEPHVTLVSDTFNPQQPRFSVPDFDTPAAPEFGVPRASDAPPHNAIPSHAPNRFRSAPQAYGNPVRQPARQPATFSQPADRFDAPPEPFLNEPQPILPPEHLADPVNLMDGMAYLLRVTRKQEGELTQAIMQNRMYGGKQVPVTDMSDPHGVPELRIFAEDVEVTSVDGNFKLTCQGNVSVVASQSMLQGDGLSYEDGVFRIESSDIVTPDTEIKAGEIEFAFVVGGVSVDRIVHARPLEPAGDELNQSHSDPSIEPVDFTAETEPQSLEEAPPVDFTE